MAVLTVSDDIYRKIEESAQKEKVSREEFVRKAIRIYLRQKSWERLCVIGKEMRESGITEDDVNAAFREVREERKRENENSNRQ